LHLRVAAYGDLVAVVVGLWQQPATSYRRRIDNVVQEERNKQQLRGGREAYKGSGQQMPSRGGQLFAVRGDQQNGGRGGALRNRLS
jgi:hypothetical protein